jgi:hypothetical protein
MKEEFNKINTEKSEILKMRSIIIQTKTQFNGAEIGWIKGIKDYQGFKTI